MATLYVPLPWQTNMVTPITFEYEVVTRVQITAHDLCSVFCYDSKHDEWTRRGLLVRTFPSMDLIVLDRLDGTTHKPDTIIHIEYKQIIHPNKK